MKSLTGVLLVNLGTPSSPAPKDVGIYLKEFLMDPWVVDIPWPARWALVNLLVVPKRKYASSKLYQKIWQSNGSPLLSYSEALSEKVNEELQRSKQIPAWLAMRYGQPSLEKVLQQIRQAGVTKLVVLPLYPQYSLAATESSIQRVKTLVSKMGWKNLELEFVPAFFDSEEYLQAVSEVSKPYIDDFKPDKVLFSFHGLPERQVKKTDRSGKHCLSHKGCCDVLLPANRDCYRAQSYWTAKWVAKRLGIKDYLVGFQSRLGRTPWIQPFSDHLYGELPKQGVKRLAVLSPSFVADCLETIEEIGIRAKEQFRSAGGEDLLLVPSLNAEPVWVKAVQKILQGNLQGTLGARL